MGIETAIIVGGIAAAGAAGGAYMQGEAQKDAARIQKGNRIANPYYEETMTRMMAIIDKTMAERGITALVPEDKLPANLRTPEQRQQVRTDILVEQGVDPVMAQQEAQIQPVQPQNALPNERAKELAIERQDGKSTGNPFMSSTGVSSVTPLNGITSPLNRSSVAPEVTQNPEVAKISGDPSVDAANGNYTDAALAATIAAQQKGITLDKPMFETPRNVYEKEQAERQKPIDEVYNYIYGQRTMGA